MRVLLVTSKVTFIPDNYNGMILPLANDPHIAGLLVLDNSDPKHLLQGLGFAAVGARRTGLQLLRNQLCPRTRERRQAYEQAGKFYLELPTINAAEAVDLVLSENIDLIVNARTRFIYRKEILNAPRLGCINVHHGLLPDQRGTMCDLWALSRGQAAGFTVHAMNEKIDDGGLLKTVTVSDGNERNYMAYQRKSAGIEAATLSEVLQTIATRDALVTTPNQKTAEKHFRNPGVPDIRAMLAKGMKL